MKVPGNTPTTITFTNVFPGDGGTPAPPDSDIRNDQGGPAGTNIPAGGGGGTGTEVSGTNETNPGSNPQTAVLGATETAPEAIATLPRTGGDPGPMTVAGVWSLVAGGLALLAGRGLRRRA